MIDLPIMCFYGTFDEFRIGGVVAIKGGGGGGGSRSSHDDDSTEYVNGGALCTDATNGINYTSTSFAMVSTRLSEKGGGADGYG